MSKPVRLQLSRRKGFNLQELSRATNCLKAVAVTRGPGRRHGNPFTIAFCQQWFNIGPTAARRQAVELFRQWRTGELEAGWTDLIPPPLDDIRGCNLACSCPLDGEPCHADILLELANGGKG